MSDANLTLDTGNAGSSLSQLSSGGGSMPAMRARMTGFFRQPAIARSMPMLGLLAVVAMAGIAWMSLREAPQRDLFRGLPDSDKSAVVESLGKTAIPYKFGSDGTITVSEDDYFKAKMQLAAEGLPKSAPDGESMIDSMPMGASRAVEGEKLRSAREADLARTIEAIDAVKSAKVHLAVEPPSVFLRDRTKPSASVMLRLADGRSLSDAQVQAIVHLVASSVTELQPEDVSVVDQNGRLLTSGQDDGGVNDRQLQLQSQIEDRYRQSVVSLLTPILGAGKFSTEVHAELNFAERQATRETYPQDEARLVAEQGSWSADGKDGEAGGMPGALAATPPAAGTASATPPASIQPPVAGQAAAGTTGATPGTPGAPPLKTNETFNRSFELGREVSVTKDAVGTVKRLSIAVALDNAPGGKPRSVAEVAALEALVKGAVGFDQTRGDVVALSGRKFVPVTEEVAPWYDASWVSLLVRNVSALLVVMVLIFGIGRPLLKRRAAAREEASADQGAMRARLGSEISAELSRSAATPQAAAGTVTLDMISSTQGYADRATLIRNFVKQDPDRAALVVRDLLKEGVK